MLSILLLMYEDIHSEQLANLFKLCDKTNGHIN